MVVPGVTREAVLTDGAIVSLSSFAGAVHEPAHWTAFLHRDHQVARAEQQLTGPVRGLSTEAVKTSDVRDHTVPAC